MYAAPNSQQAVKHAWDPKLVSALAGASPAKAFGDIWKRANEIKQVAAAHREAAAEPEAAQPSQAKPAAKPDQHEQAEAADQAITAALELEQHVSSAIGHSMIGNAALCEGLRLSYSRGYSPEAAAKFLFAEEQFRVAHAATSRAEAAAQHPFNQAVINHLDAGRPKGEHTFAQSLAAVRERVGNAARAVSAVRERLTTATKASVANLITQVMTSRAVIEGTALGQTAGDLVVGAYRATRGWWTKVATAVAAPVQRAAAELQQIHDQNRVVAQDRATRRRSTAP